MNLALLATEVTQKIATKVVVKSLLNVTGLNSAYEKWQRDKREAARRILATELVVGIDKVESVISEDELFSAIYLYEQAFLKGATTKNLTLMAKVIKGSISAKEIKIDKCNHLQKILADLTEEECILVGSLWDAYVHLDKTGLSSQILEKLTTALVPNIYPTQEHLSGALLGLSRTGLVRLGLTFDEIGQLAPSPLLNEVVELITVESFRNIIFEKP